MAYRAVAVQVICLSSALFCCITEDWCLFQAASGLFASRSDAALAAGDSVPSSDPLNRPPLLLGVSRNTMGSTIDPPGSHSLRCHQVRFDWAQRRCRAPFLRALPCSKAVLPSLCCPQWWSPCGSRCCCWELPDPSCGWTYRSSGTQRKEEELQLRTLGRKETTRFWSPCLQRAEPSLDLLLPSIWVLQRSYQRLLLLLPARSVWTKDRRNKAEKVFDPRGFPAVQLFFKQTLRV